KHFLDPVIETKEHLSQESSENKSPNHNIYVSEEPDEIKPTKSQYIKQGLMKQLRSNRDIVLPVSLEIMEHQLSQNKAIEICCEIEVTDKTARTQLYKEMLSHLPGITLGNLCMKTLKAKKIRMLFGKDRVGIEKIKQVTYTYFEESAKYLNWHAKLVDSPSHLSDKIRLNLYRAYTEETGLDSWINSKTPEPPQIEKDAEKKTLFVLQINV
ncbi:311_t:CDS:2, partial [Racocetra fulgida]